MSDQQVVQTESSTTDVTSSNETLDFLDERYNRPFREYVNYFRLGNRHAVNTPSLPRVVWGSDDSYTNLIIDSYEYSLDDLTTLINTIYELCIHKLKTEILFCGDLPNLMNANGKLVDKISSNATGYSFLNEPENICLGNVFLKTFVVQNIISSETLSREFFGTNTEQFQWNMVRFKAWMNNVGELVIWLAILAHLTSGQPARGTEITSYTICNTMGNTRSLYWLHDTIMLSQTYSKTRAIKSDMHVVRFLPQKIALLFIYYLTCVRPLEIIFFGENEAVNVYKTMLFVVQGKNLNSRQLSIELNRYANSIIGKPLKLSTYRHIAIAFMWGWVAHFDINTTSSQEGEEVDDVVADEGRMDRMRYLVNEQASHTVSVASRIYAISNEDFRFVDRQKLHSFFLCSKEWHKLLNIENGIINQSTSEKPSVVENVEEVLAEERLTPSRSGRGTYKSSTNILPIFLDSMGSLTLDNKSSRKGLTAGAVKSYHLMQLRKFLRDDNAIFKSHQQGQAFVETLKRQSDLLVVLPTGGGKSLLYMLPSYIEQQSRKVTILVVPLVSLMHDTLDRCIKSGLNVQLWRGSLSTDPNASILLVAPEQCNQSDLQTHIDNLYNTGRLSRIVVDECHLTLTWAEFRESMYLIHKIRRHSVPLLLLSATVPMKMENALRIAYASNFNVIRSNSTVRRNLKYSVVEFKKDVINCICNRIQQRNLTEACGIIYVPFVNQTIQYAPQISNILGVNCLPFHGRMETENKQRALNQFLEGTAPVIVATSAFGAGIGKPNVSYVYHISMPDSILDYAQESGRSGRDENCVDLADCCIFYNQESIDRLKHFRIQGENQFFEEKEREMNEVEKYLKNKHDCRRFIMHQHLDPEPVSCLSGSTGVQLCDNCESSLEESKNKEQDLENEYPPENIVVGGIINNERLNKRKDVMISIEAGLNKMDYQNTSCIICVIHYSYIEVSNQVNNSSHALEECPNIELADCCFKCVSPLHKRNECPYIATVKAVKPHICYTCLMPLEEVDGVLIHRGSTTSCDSEALDKVLPAITSIRVYNEILNDTNAQKIRIQNSTIQRITEEGFQEEADLANWLFQRDVETGLLNILVVFASILETYVLT